MVSGHDESNERDLFSRYLGNVFEKRLIEAYIAEHGKDPVTGEDLSSDDLVELKTQRVVRPRPPTLTSIPSLLGVFQEEWDALALETYTLRQTLAQTRQELSTALYQHDAAVRVIARLTKERDEARDALSKVSVGAVRGPSGDDAMQVDSAGLPEAILARIESTQATCVLHLLAWFKDHANLLADFPRVVVSARCRKAGLLLKQSRDINLSKPRKHYILEGSRYPLTQPVILHLSEV